MSIYNDRAIHLACKELDLVVPYVPEHVNPASIDLTLGDTFINKKTGETFQVQDSITILPGDFYLGHSQEYVRIPDYVAASLSLKSTRARQGLDHSLAGWVDSGYQGRLTMEFSTHVPITLKVGDRVAQLVFFQMVEAAQKPYQGRYQCDITVSDAKLSEL